VLSNVASLQALVVGLATTSVGPADSASLQITITDGASTVTASLVHAGKNSAVTCSQASELRVSVTTSLGTSNEPLLCGPGTDLPSYRLDVMTPLYGVGAAVARLKTPFSVTLATTTSGSSAATGTYMGAWLDTSGVQRTAGSGTSSSYAVSQAGG